MAYDSFYGDLSTRGTANDILSQVLVAQQNVEMTSTEVEELSNRVLADAQTIIGSISSAVSAAAQADAASVASQANRTASAASAAQAQQAAIDAISNGASAVVIANRAEIASQAANARSGQAIEVANSIDAKVNTATQVANTAKATAESANSNAIAATQAANNAANLVGGKVNRSGDTFTGDVYINGGSTNRRLSVVSQAPALEMHKLGALAGQWYINSANQFSLGQTGGNGIVSRNLMTIDTGGTGYFAGGIESQGNASFRQGVNVGGNLSTPAALTAGSGYFTNGHLQVTAATEQANAHLWFFNPSGITRGVLFASPDGTLRWQQKDGKEIVRFQPDGNIVAQGQIVSEARMYANKGLTVSDGGANVNGDIRTNLGVYALQLSSTGQITADGNVVVKGNVTAGGGNGVLQGDGNIYGQVWGNRYLSQYLEDRYLTVNNVDPRIANWNANIGAGAIGTHGFLANTSGTNINVNGTLGTGLTWAASGNPNGGNAGGTWRCLGYGFNGSYTLWVRVA